MSRRALSLAVLLAGLPAGSAWGWGPYGHEAVEAAALELLTGRRHPLARLLAPNAGTLKRLAITPDVDWKIMSGMREVPPAQLEKQKGIALLEEPLHYFEADAFVDMDGAPNAAAALPSGEYGDVHAAYQKLRGENAERVRRMAPGKPPEAAAHGTAPWRVLQLYDLAVEAMQKRDAAKALFYLGALGHYVGDLAQPLHLTMDFDGQRSPFPAAGAHAAFESGILSLPSEDPDAAYRKIAGYAAVAGTAAAPALRRQGVVREMLRLVDGGYGFAAPVLRAFSDECALAGTACRASKEGALPEVPEPVLRAFAAARIGPVPQKGVPRGTVLDAAHRRLGAGAVVLARVWSSAYEDAGRPDLGSPRLRFSDLNVVDNYPAPAYLPKEAMLAQGVDAAALPPPEQFPSDQEVTPLSAILKDKKRYEGKPVCIAGPTSTLFEKYSRKGNHYFTVWISEGEARIKVFCFGFPKFKEGDEIEACGWYQQEKRVSGRIFFDEFTAEAVLSGKAMRSGRVELTPRGVRMKDRP